MLVYGRHDTCVVSSSPSLWAGQHTSLRDLCFLLPLILPHLKECQGLGCRTRYWWGFWADVTDLKRWASALPATWWVPKHAHTASSSCGCPLSSWHFSCVWSMSLSHQWPPLSLSSTAIVTTHLVKSIDTCLCLVIKFFGERKSIGGWHAISLSLIICGVSVLFAFTVPSRLMLQFSSRLITSGTEVDQLSVVTFLFIWWCLRLWPPCGCVTCFPRYGIPASRYLLWTSLARTSLVPYLAGLLGICILNGQFPLNARSC